MEQVTVWVDGWQMQCCGHPFKKGEQVKWTVARWRFEQPFDGCNIDYSYELHGGDEIEIAGTVMDIKAAYFINLPDEGILVDLEKEADGWEENRGKYKFDAYLVKLKS